MEGKCVLFKTFGGVDAIPLCVRSKEVDDIVKTVKLLAGSFGGVNLEDISAPRCFEIEKRLKEDPEIDIPIFHDDQHGTAVVVLAGLLNALHIAGKNVETAKIVFSGAGAAAIAVCKLILAVGAKNITMFDIDGAIYKGREQNHFAHEEISKYTNLTEFKGNLKDGIKGADVFIGLSAPNLLDEEMIKSMNEKAILFTLANPIPEISYDDAKEAGAFIVGTGSSEKPNQINNVLVFPGLFRGALDVRANTINQEMMIAASQGIMECVSDEELCPEYILPYAWNEKAHQNVAKRVAEAAIKTKVNKI
jgi:malate dehydrogenase (oxaloacetate-decarboxylating)